MIDLIGETYGYLLVIGNGGQTESGIRYWKCKCVCGKKLEVRHGSLRSGNTKSCGCKKSASTITHGHCIGAKKGKVTSEYITYQSMIGRCYTETNINFYNYGANGVTVCNRWLKGFKFFFEDMGGKPSSKHSLDRIKHNKPYSKENCRWATTKEQTRNRRTSVWVSYAGKKMVLADWARLFKCPATNLSRRLKKQTFKQVYEYYTNR